MAWHVHIPESIIRLRNAVALPRNFLSFPLHLSVFPDRSSHFFTVTWERPFSLSPSLLSRHKALLLLVYRIPDLQLIRLGPPLQDQSRGHRNVSIHSSRPPSIDDIIIIIIVVVDITSLVTEKHRHIHTSGRYDPPDSSSEPPLSSLTLSYLPTRYFC